MPGFSSSDGQRNAGDRCTGIKSSALTFCAADSPCRPLTRYSPVASAWTAIPQAPITKRLGFLVTIPDVNVLVRELGTRWYVCKSQVRPIAISLRDTLCRTLPNASYQPGKSRRTLVFGSKRCEWPQQVVLEFPLHLSCCETLLLRTSSFFSWHFRVLSGT